MLFLQQMISWRNYILLVLLTGCAKSEEMLSAQPDPSEKEFKTYIIKAGEHYSDGAYQTVKGRELSFEAIFDSTCIYKTKSKENSSDINKLYGFSDCNTLHHENSARVGWRWNGKNIELHGYCYTGNNRISKPIGTAEINEIIKLSITVSSLEYIFTYKGSKTAIGRYCGDSEFNGYRLYPYFGGDEPAPHDIVIRIR